MNLSKTEIRNGAVMPENTVAPGVKPVVWSSTLLKTQPQGFGSETLLLKEASMGINLKRLPPPDPGTPEAAAQRVVIDYLLTGHTLTNPDLMAKLVVQAIVQREAMKQEQSKTLHADEKAAGEDS